MILNGITQSSPPTDVKTKTFDDLLKILDKDRDGSIGLSKTVICVDTDNDGIPDKEIELKDYVAPETANGKAPAIRIEQRGINEIELYLKTIIDGSALDSAKEEAFIKKIFDDLGVQISAQELKSLRTSTRPRKTIISIIPLPRLAHLIAQKISPEAKLIITEADWNHTKGLARSQSP